MKHKVPSTKYSLMCRIGIGHDTHRLVEGRAVVRGGGRIGSGGGGEGHSDGDALCHALADAILGALCEGDLGAHFPDDDPRWKDADSIQLLAHISRLTRERGFQIVNADATIMLERPKLREHIAAMRGTLAEAMLHSGEILDFSDIPKPKADKHSTGGVGDKTSLLIAPFAAAAGVCVPMISGRGLGHTGGTLDKLESIPGYRVDLSLKEFRAVLDQSGFAMNGQTAEIAPADKKLYALRDATAP